MRKLSFILPLVVLLVLMLAAPVIAAGAYRSEITISDTSDTSRTGVPVLAPLGIVQAVELGYLDADGSDTRLLEGTQERYYMVAGDRIGILIPTLSANQERLYGFETEWDTPSTFGIIAGEDGYVTILDDTNLELGSNFQIEQKGWVDTSAGSGKNLVNKEEAFRTYVSDVNEITSAISLMDPIDVTPAIAASWQTVNVASYMPSGATGAIVQLYYSVLDVAAEVSVREVGSTDDRITNKSNTGNAWTIVGLDGSMEFQAYVEDGNAKVYLIGYTGSGWVFKANDDDISLTNTVSWRDIDVTGNTSEDTVAVLVEIVDGTNNAYGVGLRKKGSGDARINDILAYSHAWALVGVDADEILQGYIENEGVDFYLSAYYEGSNLVMQTNGTSKSLTSTVTWTDIDCSGEVPVGTTYVMFEAVETHYEYGFRIDGGSTDYHNASTRHSWAIAPVDCNRVCEGYIESTNVSFYLLGYVTVDADLPIAAEVTATSVSSGEHIIKTTADGTNLKIFVADPPDYNFVEKDSMSLGGASVPDNSNNWLLVQNSVMPYMEYYKHTVSGTLIARYQPNTIILGEEYSTETATFENGSDAVVGNTTVWTEGMVGGLMRSIDDDSIWFVVESVEDTTHLTLTTNYSDTGGAGHTYSIKPRLIDREGALEDGAITWGTNSDLDVEVGGLKSISSYIPEGTEEGEPPEILPIPGEIDLWGEEAPVDIPWLPSSLITPAAALLGWGNNTLIGVLIIFAAIGVGVGAAIATGSALLAAIAVGIGLAVGASTGVVGWWVVIVFAIFGGTYIVAARSM